MKFENDCQLKGEEAEVKKKQQGKIFSLRFRVKESFILKN